jgi:hypothetical protein
MDVPQFTDSTDERHLDYFQFLTIMNEVAITFTVFVLHVWLFGV